MKTIHLFGAFAAAVLAMYNLHVYTIRAIEKNDNQKMSALEKRLQSLEEDLAKFHAFEATRSDYIIPRIKLDWAELQWLMRSREYDGPEARKFDVAPDFSGPGGPPPLGFTSLSGL